MSLKAIEQLFAEIRSTPIGELYEKLGMKSVASTPASQTLPPPQTTQKLDAVSAELVRRNVSYKELCDEFVKAALKTASGNKSAAARLIGMDRKAYERRLRRVKK